MAVEDVFGTSEGRSRELERVAEERRVRIGMGRVFEHLVDRRPVGGNAIVRRMRRAVPLAAFLGVAAATSVALLPLCALLHRCGCRAPWAGGLDHCNVRNARGPHCPWCEHQALGALATGGTFGGQGLAFLAVRRRKGTTTRSVLAAVAALPVSLLVSGAVAWLATDYPHFIVQDARARLRIPDGPLRSVVAPGATAVGDCCPPKP